MSVYEMKAAEPQRYTTNNQGKQQEEPQAGITHGTVRPRDLERQDGGEGDEFELIEYRLMRHNYLITRPRALQYSYKSKLVHRAVTELSPSTSESTATPLRFQNSDNPDDHEVQGKSSRHYHEDVSKHRERLDLFIDLIWVGIISNLSEVFSYFFFESSNGAGVSTLLFLLVFLPSFRIWNFLREFLNNYYSADITQRFFIFWILVLSVFYGNNLAYFTEKPTRVKNILITLYLCIRVSFVLMELVYSIWIPWLRRLLFINFLISVPSTAFWLAAIFVKGDNAAAPAAVAVAWEYIVPTLMNLPWGSKFVPSEYRRETDSEHLTTRMGNFFIISLGEGVGQLIKDGPLGIGITSTAGSSIWSLSIYFLLAFLYYARDQSAQYIPATKRGGWRSFLWITLHIPVFASLITLTSGLLFLIRQQPSESYSKTGFEIPEDEVVGLVHRSIWSVATSLSIIVFSITCMALLGKSLDPPRTLLINNRYARLSTRAGYIVIILTVPLGHDHFSKYLFLGIASILMVLMQMFEWVVSMERPGGIVEPKGLTVMMRRELKNKNLGETAV